MIFRTAALGLVLAVVAAPSWAQVHRWVDENGRVHYGDRPLGTTGTTLRIRSESATAPTAAGPAGPASAAPGVAPRRPPPAAPTRVPAAADGRAAPCKPQRGADCGT
jgi:hypothetical protein